MSWLRQVGRREELVEDRCDQSRSYLHAGRALPCFLRLRCHVCVEISLFMLPSLTNKIDDVVSEFSFCHFSLVSCEIMFCVCICRVNCRSVTK